MSKARQKKDYEWFEKNRESLYQKYPDKFAVISNEALLGVFDTFDEALEHALNEKKANASQTDIRANHIDRYV